MVSHISELRHVYLFLEEIMCSLCVINELLEPFSLHHGCQQMHFMAVEKSRKGYDFVIYS